MFHRDSMAHHSAHLGLSRKQSPYTGLPSSAFHKRSWTPCELIPSASTELADPYRRLCKSLMLPAACLAAFPSRMPQPVRQGLQAAGGALA